MGYCNTCERLTMDKDSPIHKGHSVTPINYEKLLKLIKEHQLELSK